MQHQDLSPPTVLGPHPRQRIGAARRTADAQDRCRAGDLMVAGGYGSSAVVVRSTAPSSWSNSTFVGAITNDPCNVSVLVVGGLIVPYGFDIAATVSNSHRSPAGNITRVLTEARGFNVAASLLEASGVTDDFEADERGARITIFALLAQGTSLHATSNAGVCTLDPFEEMPDHNGHNDGPVHWN
ncbi:fasciclin-like arabinogalactan protein 4 [Triticum aestivum]|uniref:fasciclin-like arabinogalactan protein 4 n=1 Tax=Triticum aestivum TaxID=4565 RepID=UPI001D00ACB3|nr:fasciclin-like arabinogalactan protein 4 [Triticum aestivum]